MTKFKQILMVLVLAGVLLPAVASAGERLVGLGGTGALGVYIWDEEVVFAYDASFEVRLFPTDGFSIDLNIDLAESAVATQVKTFFHFHVKSEGNRAYFSVAPFLSVTGVRAAQFVDDDGSGVFGLGSRIGGELLNPNRVFAMGIYLRPAFHYSLFEEEPLGEVVFELTWMLYPPKPGQEQG